MRISHQAPGDTEALTHTQRGLVAGQVLLRIQPDEAQQIRQRIMRGAQVVGMQMQVLEECEAPIEGGVFDEMPTRLFTGPARRRR